MRLSREIEVSGSAESSEMFKSFGPETSRKEIIVKQKKKDPKNVVNVPEV